MLRHKTYEPVTYAGDEFVLDFEVKRLNFIEGKAFAVSMDRTRRDRVNKHMLMAQAEHIGRQQRMLARHNALLVEHDKPAIDAGQDIDQAVVDAGKALEAAGLVLPPMTADEVEALLQQDEDRADQRHQAMQEFLESLKPEFLEQVFRDYVRNVTGFEVDGEAITTGEALLKVADQSLVMFVIGTIEGFSKLSGAAKKVSSSPLTSEPVAGTDAGESPATSAAPDSGTDLATATEPLAPVSSSE